MAVHRLRLEYKCVTELDSDAIRLQSCVFCTEDQKTPLLHYLLECPHAAMFLRREGMHPAPGLIPSMNTAKVQRLVRPVPRIYELPL